jgi:hypothetical protein
MIRGPLTFEQSDVKRIERAIHIVAEANQNATAAIGAKVAA